MPRTLPVEKLPGLAVEEEEEEEERQVLQEAGLKKEPLEEARGSLERFSRALFKADLNRLEILVERYHEDVNVAFKVNRDELKWQVKSTAMFGLSGLWSLEYKRELTNPLCITAAQGYTDCLRYLLEHGAQPNLAPGGKTALHEACENSNTDCAMLLLQHGANPNLLNEDGLAPLHLCKTSQSFRCAKVLLKHGAVVGQPSEEECETPLHVAAKHGLNNHLHLYLRNGAAVDCTDRSGETPLGAACAGAQNPEELENYLQVCHLLLLYGADANAVDKENRSPLHKACRNTQHSLVMLLLENKADINAIDYNGGSPLSNVLQNSNLKQDLQPHLTMQSLLNHGAHKVWPLAFLKVLTLCASAPKTIEVLFNSYHQIQVTCKWMEAVPEEIYQDQSCHLLLLFSVHTSCRGHCELK
ncbi:ankyrin repeat and SOCS box protein 18-like isoform X2 [Huso huso]|uniref:Ankyrin repeat and SOCS box protein 18-like isoform X2 n=1 Tax=Huso huso TaxID=61971 RepID=A0ABR0ZDZ4_HUSHU